MTIAEIKSKFSDDVLTAVQYDKELRYLLYMPLFSNLFESKVVYHERFTCIVKLQNVDISPDYFSAFVVPLHHIITDTPISKRHEYALDRLRNGWEISCRWNLIRLIGTGLCSSPHSCWQMWVDPIQVQKVEKLTLEYKYKEALNLTLFEDDYNKHKI